MKEIYTMPYKEAQAEIIEKRSRFIASVKPVTTEEEALAFLNELRQKYWDATHNVYAYIIEENNIMRYSDDGEPGGTAGLPVLDMLKKEGLSNVIVVVTRYFGGILLGTGGLVHAYSKSAKAGILEAGIVDMVLCKAITIDCDYTLLGKVQNLLSDWEGIIRDEAIYGEGVSLPLHLPVADAQRFCDFIIDKTNARAEITQGETTYYPKKR